MTLEEYIASKMNKPFLLGRNDCAHFIAEWLKVQTGKDPLIPFDGLPQTTAQDLVTKGKLTRSVAIGCRSIGLKRTDTPHVGDVGVIRRPHCIQCAIYGKSGWIFFDEKGIGMIKTSRVLAVWRVLCQPQ